MSHQRVVEPVVHLRDGKQVRYEEGIETPNCFKVKESGGLIVRIPWRRIEEVHSNTQEVEPFLEEIEDP